MGTEKKIDCYTEKTPNVVTTTNLGIVKSSNSIDKAQVSASISVKSNNGYDGLKQQQLQETWQQESAAEAVVPYVRVYVDENNVIEGAKEILKVIRPHWDLNVVQFKKFTDGITNKLVGCFYEPVVPTTTDGNINCIKNGHCTANGHTANGEVDVEKEKEKQKPQYSNVVLVRVYGNKTDLLIDRKAETRNIMLLHKYGLAPSLYATFKNGLAYDYVPGVTLNASNVLCPEVWPLVARRMAQLHRVKSPKTNAELQEVPMLWKKMIKFFDLVPERFNNAITHARLESTFLPIERMRAEFDDLYGRLESLKSPLVFAHNDLLLGNVIYTESQKSVTFIDYEYADYNFQAFDIGNHFAEFAGVDEVDYSRYPAREFQLAWLNVYLCTYKEQTEVSDDDLERLYVQVNQFSLAAHFFWTIWSLLQAEYSTNEFDYASYALIRYNEYLKRKTEFLALKFDEPSSS